MNLSFDTIFTKNDRITVREARNLAQSGQPVSMVLPLSIGIRENAEWTFPVEPLISVSGKNVIVRRNVAKSERRGTIKERWAEDDFSINIQGSFIHPDLYTYPEDDVQKLMYYIRQKKALCVKNALFEMLGINQIVVESFSFPFSKGENVQNFSIDAYSDDLYELFIDVKGGVYV
jgi:hypothetical protein